MPGRPLSRRTAVGTAVGSALAAPLALAACDIDPPDRAPASAGATPDPEPPEDAELVASVVASLLRARSVLEAATLEVPALGPRLAPMGAAHAAHLEVLAGAVPDAAQSTPPPASVPGRIVRALAVVRRSEQRLQREVREAAVAAASGDLARVLASVAASTSQHVAALSTEVTS